MMRQWGKLIRIILPILIGMLIVEGVVLCQDLAQNKMRSFATKLLTENRPSHRFFRSR